MESHRYLITVHYHYLSEKVQGFKMNFFMIFSYDRVAVVKVFCFIFAYLWFSESTYYSLKKKMEIVLKQSTY